MNPINMSEFFTQTLDWVTTPFKTHVGIYFWPAIFTTAIAITYMLTKSIGSVLAVIVLIFGLFGTTQEVLVAPEFQLFFSVIAALGLAGLVLSLFLKEHG